MLQEAQRSLVTTLAYVQSPGVWGGLVRQYEAQGMQYFGFDFTGSTRLVGRPGGTVTDSYDYKAFGEELQSGTSATPTHTGGAWGYHRDVATQAVCAARYLRTDLGRGISRDPIGREALMSNLYAYCRDCPTEIIDPSGAVCTYLSATLTPDGTLQTIKIPAGAYIVTDTIPGGPKVGQTVGKQMNLSSNWDRSRSW